MGRFINPFTDFGFKFLFGREVEKELLIDFLNDLLVGEHVITDIQFLNSEQQPEVKAERVLVDVFSKIKAIFKPSKYLCEILSFFNCLNFMDKSINSSSSCLVKSISFKKDLVCGIGISLSF